MVWMSIDSGDGKMKTKKSKIEIKLEKVFEELADLEEHTKQSQTANKLSEQDAISILNHLRDMKQYLRSKT